MKLFIAIATLCLATVPAVSHAAEADHHHHEEGPKKLALDEGGKKWATDAALRKGMEQLKTLVEADHPPIHAKKFTTEGYRALSKKLEEPIGEIFRTCKLPPKADAMLHVVLLDVLDAMKVMGGDAPVTEKRSAFVRIVTSLNGYGEHFDHPGWARVR